MFYYSVKLFLFGTLARVYKIPSISIRISYVWTPLLDWKLINFISTLRRRSFEWSRMVDVFTKSWYGLLEDITASVKNAISNNRRLRCWPKTERNPDVKMGFDADTQFLRSSIKAIFTMCACRLMSVRV